ncbi:MAG: hypothetical protein EHM28_06645 [Spirochaetaceae bacterium]|nr:MAG: hypothetical protein EHM28_06645 [Spirochaetaceae bacterium]
MGTAADLVAYGVNIKTLDSSQSIKLFTEYRNGGWKTSVDKNLGGTQHALMKPGYYKIAENLIELSYTLQDVGLPEKTILETNCIIDATFRTPFDSSNKVRLMYKGQE